MLSLRLLKVDGVVLPDSASAPSEAVPSWTVELRHGSEKHRVEFLGLASSSNPASLLQHEPRRTDLRTASGSPWEREIEIEDKEGEDKVDVTLLLDRTSPNTVPRRRQMFRHSMASIDLQTFRAQPEKRVEVWLPLQPANPLQGDSRDYGAMQVAVMYTDDYVAQGYMFGLFCGLSPLWARHPS